MWHPAVASGLWLPPSPRDRADQGSDRGGTDSADRNIGIARRLSNRYVRGVTGSRCNKSDSTSHLGFTATRRFRDVPQDGETFEEDVDVGAEMH